MFREFSRLALICLAIVCFACTKVSARQDVSQEQGLKCQEGWKADKLNSHCEIKERTLPASSGTISVDGQQNGGVSIKGWDRVDMLVRSMIQTSARTEDEARQIATLIQVQTGGAQIQAEGPEQGQDKHWSVSYEIFVPHRTDLSLKTHNGGISIADVSGRIVFTAHNGGVRLQRLGGSVQGETTNGGLSVDLSGERWEGEGLDIRTTNGGVRMSVPNNYSAHIESRTVHGGMKVDFPRIAQGSTDKEFAADIGSGGARVRAVTTNGGVKISRR